MNKSTDLNSLYAKGNSFLWDIRHPDYSHKTKRNDTLNILAQTLMDLYGQNFTVDGIKAKLGNLRDQYLRERKKVEASKLSGCNSVDTYKPRWVHYEALSFLSTRLTDLAEEDKNLNDESADNILLPVLDGVKDMEDDLNINQTNVPQVCADEQIHNICATTNDANFTSLKSESTQSKCSYTTIENDESAAKKTKDTENLQNKAFVEALAILKSHVGGTSFMQSYVSNESSHLLSEDYFGKHVSESLKSIQNKYRREVTKFKIQQILLEAIDPDD